MRPYACGPWYLHPRHWQKINGIDCNFILAFLMFFSDIFLICVIFPTKINPKHNSYNLKSNFMKVPVSVKLSPFSGPVLFLAWGIRSHFMTPCTNVVIFSLPEILLGCWKGLRNDLWKIRIKIKISQCLVSTSTIKVHSFYSVVCNYFWLNGN